MRYVLISSPLGMLTIGSTDRGVSAVRFGSHVPDGATVDAAANQPVIDQLEEYFQGKRTHFDLELDLQGTDFQISVWNELTKIPYGQTRSYGDIAKTLGKPGAARAVGMANHENPVAVVVPCHRVIGQNGSLTGYAGGLHIKQKLLAIEQGPPLFT